MPLDTIIEHLQTATKHATTAAEAIDAADHSASEAHGVAQGIGLRRETASITELQARLKIAADQMAAIRTTIDECLTTAEDFKHGTGPRVTPLPQPADTTPSSRHSSEPWWRAYAGPLVMGLWSLVLLSSPLWDRAQLWLPINALFAGAALWTNLLGSRRPFRNGTHVALWTLLAFAVVAPLVELAIRHSITVGRVVGFIMLVAEMAALIVFCRHKRHTDAATRFQSSADAARNKIQPRSMPPKQTSPPSRAE